MAVPACVVLLLSAVIRASLALRPTISGADFFAYVCFGRDLALGPGPMADARFLYFPGSFRFWQGAILLGATNLARLQWTFWMVIVAGALATAALVARSESAGPPPIGERRLPAFLWPARGLDLLLGLAALAAVLLFTPAFEGYLGGAETIAVLPALGGALVWSGAPLRGRQGFVRAVALGAGLGAAVFVKQQAGLLALGWLALLPFAVAPARLHEVTKLLAVPASAFATLLLLFSLDGGLPALKQGLSQLAAYAPANSPAVNAGIAYSQGWLIFWPAIVLFGWWTLAAGLPSLRGAVSSRAGQLAGFCLLAGLSSLAQLRWRSYLHYLQLSLPFLVVGCFVGARVLVSWMRGRLSGPLVTSLPALALVFALARASSLLPVTLFSLEVQSAPAWDWPDEPASRDLDRLAEVVRPGEDLLVLPSRRNAVHYRLGTRSDSWPLGYIWPPREPGQYPLFIRARKPELVLVLTSLVDGASRADRENCVQGDCAAAVSALPEAGYTVAARLPTMTLWRRGP